ncbi:hypothetical protein ACFV27_37085 [Streptomyces antimycoticus]|uniref:hypothetical protein n=1 Tax=Streptomyces antimycoticus TaxID=68175 RepID=UPI0036B5A70A
MFDPEAPLTAKAYRQLHDIADNTTLARLIAEHPNNTAGVADDGESADPTADPDYVPNPPYDLPTGVSSWSDWCR